ncbi:MAG: adenosylmethionine--8-amino-7-oxononanoate transaminase [Pseudomonadota bacterium]|nr:adenosylmethionine--8-amino-7-oxononanoate transaminase [Pseudomonadota bacterium]
MKTLKPIAPVWLPYTQMKTAPEPLLVQGTQGSRIRLADGRELVDGVASWWTACHGYNHPHIASALHQQIDAMPHIMLGGMLHPPAQRLAERLGKLAPGDLNHVFFSDSGSVAVEVALKIAVQYALNQGQKGRNKFVHFRGGYHGDTMACMSVCDPEEGMHAHFKGWLPEQLIAELPHNDQSASALDALMRRRRDTIAGVIIEPLVQGVGGMKFHDAATLRRVEELCRANGLLLIADEIFTGFGRTGTMFACEQAGVVPDILCLGKALSGGPVSLAATLVRAHVFEAFLSDSGAAALMHGPTYMANALACAAANASLDLFETEPRLSQVISIERKLQEGLEPCRDLSGVADLRVKGAIGVVQFAVAPDFERLRQMFIERGTWVRVFGDVVYLTPAFTIGEDDLAKLTRSVVDVVAAYGAGKG